MSDREMSKDEALKDEAEPRLTTSATPIGPAPADLLRTAADPSLTEGSALALLKRADLPPEAIEQLAKNTSALKSRKVKIALVSHPKTPRHVSVPLARQFYTFDLMRLALSPTVPADVKVAVDDVLISRLKTVTIGERLTLARRASGRVAAALLLDVETVSTKITDAKTAARETRVMQAALENPRLTEALVINSVLRPGASAALVHTVAQHTKWSCRREIRAALLRTEHLSLARALEFSHEIPGPLLNELLTASRLPAQIKDQLLRGIQASSPPARWGEKCDLAGTRKRAEALRLSKSLSSRAKRGICSCHSRGTLWRARISIPCLRPRRALLRLRLPAQQSHNLLVQPRSRHIPLVGARDIPDLHLDAPGGRTQMNRRRYSKRLLIAS